MLSKPICLFLVGFCLIGTVISQEIEFSGFGKTGLVVYDRDILNDYNQETYYEGKIQADLEFSDYIEAQLDIRGNSTDNSMNFREFSVKFKYNKKLRFKVGHIKRPFGYEYFLIKRDELYTIERSLLQNTLTEMGYGGRTVSIMAYYNYSDKRPELPLSYAISMFKDNSLSSGFALRSSYHYRNSAFGFNYLYQSRGGWRTIDVQGAGIDYTLDSKDLFLNAELVTVQDPFQGLQILEQQKSRREAGLPPLNMDEFVYTLGAKLITALTIEVDGDIIKDLEPVLLLAYYQPDLDIQDRHVIQTIIGGKLYFHKKVSLGLNLDVRFTRSELNSEYTTDESNFAVELQVKY